MWEFTRVIPRVEVVVCETPLAEKHVLFEENEEVGGAPVAQQGEEVLEVGVEF